MKRQEFKNEHYWEGRPVKVLVKCGSIYEADKMAMELSNALSKFRDIKEVSRETLPLMPSVKTEYVKVKFVTPRSRIAGLRVDECFGFDDDTGDRLTSQSKDFMRYDGALITYILKKEKEMSEFGSTKV